METSSRKVLGRRGWMRWWREGYRSIPTSLLLKSTTWALKCNDAIFVFHAWLLAALSWWRVFSSFLVHLVSFLFHFFCRSLCRSFVERLDWMIIVYAGKKKLSSAAMFERARESKTTMVGLERLYNHGWMISVCSLVRRVAYRNLFLTSCFAFLLLVGGVVFLVKHLLRCTRMAKKCGTWCWTRRTWRRITTSTTSYRQVSSLPLPDFLLNPRRSSLYTSALCRGWMSASGFFVRQNVQLLELDKGVPSNDAKYVAWNRWGRVGYEGQNALKNFSTLVRRTRFVFDLENS